MQSRVLPTMLSLCVFCQHTEALANSSTRRVEPAPPDIVSAHDVKGRVALVVGIDAYQDARIGNLLFAGADARAMADRLRGAGYRVVYLQEKEATADCILSEIRALGTNGQLVVYFSGHGYTFRKPNQPPENFLALSATNLDNLGETGVTVREVLAAMEATRSEHQIFISDACRNALRGQPLGRPMVFSAEDPNTSVALLQSARHGQLSYEEAALGHGVFTHFLLKGMDGEAAGLDDWITLADLAQFVGPLVEQHTKKTQPDEQSPRIGGQFKPNLLISRSPSSQRTVRTHRSGQRYLLVPGGTVPPACVPTDATDACVSQAGAKTRPQTLAPFWMTISEVTQEAWRNLLERAPPEVSGADMPVVKVTKLQAAEFCRRAGGRLPTSGEFRLAAQAPVLYGHPMGITKLAYQATAGGKVQPALWGAPNSLGFHGLRGNAWEWVEDADPLRQEYRIQGGGSSSSLEQLQPWASLKLSGPNGSESIGFRCVVEFGHNLTQ